MLIESSRFKPGDREAWGRLARYDRALAGKPRIRALEAASVEAISRFLADGPGYVSVSWGKDSVVAAHLATLADPGVRIEWVRSKHFETPETDLVRDQFLDAHPQVKYVEHVVELRNPKRGEPGYDERHLDQSADHQDVLKETLTGRYVSGVRAEESEMRRRSRRWHGVATAGTCRPIIDWAATDVFAYLERELLPVHPVYAMSFAGRLDRRWVRVHPLGSAPRSYSAVHARDTAAWEDAYYGDALARAREARQYLWEPLLHKEDGQ